MSARTDDLKAERRARPPGPHVMGNDAALWVLDVVLPFRDGGPRLPCLCLLGMCGACDRDEPDHVGCLTRSSPDHPALQPQEEAGVSA